MVIDCDRCVIHGAVCADCLVTVLGPRNAAGVSGGGLAELDAAELRALRVLAEAGMVPPAAPILAGWTPAAWRADLDSARPA